MNVPSVTSQQMTPASAALFAAQQASSSASTVRADRAALAAQLTEEKSPGLQNDPATIKKAASQFEAIIIRQLLAPSIEPIMSGGVGGDSAGGSIYGYMLTDSLADNLSKGGGLGLARMLEKQFSPHPARTDIIHSNALKPSTRPAS